MIKFGAFQGTITMISDFAMSPNGEHEGCYKFITVENGHGSIVNFVAAPTTYFLDHVIVAVGDRITGYYDANAPALLIYPPQYPALIIVKDSAYQNVKADYFDTQLVSSDGQLQLHLFPYTLLFLPNGQPFTKNPANRNLIAVYGPTTMSIPAQTTPFRVIVWC